jgi:RNA polymerase sigma factor (sigma-70 family)
MNSALTAEMFGKLLLTLDADSDRAGEKYEDLRRTLIRFFEWRGAPFPEDHADETFNRVARKLGDSIKISNIEAYCYEVARLVCLEAFKAKDNKRPSFVVEGGNIAAHDSRAETEEKEFRLACLDACMNQVTPENRQLILDYYTEEESKHKNRRKALAERLGLNREALANRVQRLRDKLQQCVMRCVRRKSAI